MSHRHQRPSQHRHPRGPGQRRAGAAWLPSGDRLVTFRVVVERQPVRDGTRRQVDVIDVACWSKRSQRSAERLATDDVVRVEGALRRRFFVAGGVRTSRYEVEADRVARVSRARAASSASSG